MNKVLKGVSVSFGLIPGLAIIYSGLGVPPIDGANYIFGGIVELTGVIALMSITVAKDYIRKWKRTSVIALSILNSCFSVLLLVLYVALYNFCIITDDINRTIYFPLRLSGDIQQMVEMAGGREAAIGYWGPNSVSQAILRMGESEILITSGVLLVTYILFYVVSTIASGIPASYLSSKNENPVAVS